MTINFLLENKIEIQPYLIEDIEIEIIFDKSFANFGTKLRKARGILEYLKQNQYKGVLLTGDPNSNFLAAFSTFFYLSGFEVYSVFYSRSGYKNINYYISQKHSHHIIKLTSKLELSNIVNKLNPNIYVVPPYGITQMAIDSLNLLWKNIDFSKYSHFCLEIGSGLTLLSLLNYLNENQIRIQLICIAIGLKVEKLKIYLNNLFKTFLNTNLDFSNIEILAPIKYPRFGKTGVEVWEFCRKMIKHKLYLEPIYSAKSLLTLKEYIKQKQNVKLAYLHQGGLPPSIYNFHI